MAVNDGDILRISTRWDNVHDQDIINVWHMRCDFDTPQTDLDVTQHLDTYISSVFVDFDDDLYDTITPVDIKVDVVQFSGGKWVVTANVGFASWGGTLNTTATDDVLPAGAAAVAFLHTGLGKHQGRKFFGGFSELANSISGAIVPAVAARILTGLTKLLTPHVIAAGNDLIAVVLDTVDGTIRDVTGVALNTFWGYQRRRRPGVGS